MPTYEYFCPNCGKSINVTCAFKDRPAETSCPDCKTVLQWKPSQMSFILKGGGWPGKEK